MKTRILVPLVALAGLACVAAAAADVEPVARLIVRFRSDVPNPADAAFLAALARRADVAGIDLLRPMSGDAYVLTMRCADARGTVERDPCAAAVARLAALDGVVAVEIDGRVRHR